MSRKILTSHKNKQPAANTYAELLRRLRATIDAGKVRATQAVERELVRTKWDTGKLILENILLNKDRADYGKEVLKRLSKDLGTSQTELTYMLEFARTYPIYPAPDKLNWAHYRELLTIHDPEKRSGIAKEAKQKKWTQRTLRREIKRLKVSKQITVTPEPKSAKLPDIKPGQLGLFSIFELGGKTYRDLGFSIWQEVQGIKVTNTKESELYTYEAQVTKVFDGDTFHAIIHLKDDLYLEQRVRLRRLDAPEIITAEGQQAKKVLQKVLNRAKDGILIKVSKGDDQYGRYMVDVFTSLSLPHRSGTGTMSDKKHDVFLSLREAERRSNLNDYVNIDQQLLDSGVFEVRG